MFYVVYIITIALICFHIDDLIDICFKSKIKHSSIDNLIEQEINSILDSSEEGWSERYRLHCKKNNLLNELDEYKEPKHIERYYACALEIEDHESFKYKTSSGGPS
jgi:hypothetical protein